MHVTGNKGDIGVARVTADLIEQGFNVLMPVDSTSPFDLVTYKNGAFTRVSVKYRTISNGKIDTHVRRACVTTGGVKFSPSKKDVDVLAFFCPDTQECYYIKIATFTGDYVCLRFNTAKGGQIKRVRYAKDYRKMLG